MPDAKRRSRGQFKKGSSGNPAGRPAGSRNQTTLVLEQLLEGDGEQLIKKAIGMAQQGNVYALRLCLERIIPPRKERCIILNSRPVESAKDLPLQFQDIVLAIAEGRITPAEGESISNVLTGHGQILAIAEFERRLASLEENKVDAKAYSAEFKAWVENNGLSKNLPGDTELCR